MMRNVSSVDSGSGLRARGFRLLICGLLALPATLHAQRHDGYRLVWSDEFDGQGAPDSANWSYERGFVRNEEHQWYRPENAWVENGLLVIEARREQGMPNPSYQEGATDWRRSRPAIEYTSSSLTTRGKHSWRYGRFEMRARIDVRPGMWPAFWTLGAGRWPDAGEIDIMEYYRGTILANVAWARERSGRAFWDDLRKPLGDYPPGWADEFHVWRMDWTPERISLYVDGELLNSTELAGTVNFDGRNPFHQPQYIIVNLAIGGANGGDPSATSFPGRYEIDYVRVYQEAS